MRFRRLSPRARTRFLASGLFLIGLSTTANLLSPGFTPAEPPGVQNLSRAALATDVPTTAQRNRDCPTAG